MLGKPSASLRSGVPLGGEHFRQQRDERAPATPDTRKALDGLSAYKLRIRSDGTEGYISRLIVWVPSKHLFRDKEYVTPPLPAFWRIGNKDHEAQLTQLAPCEGS
jgi:hypothetical protein